MPHAYISGTGMYVPERVVTNEELATLMDTTDEWITSRTGIKERHWISGDQSTSDLAVPATNQALKAAGLAVTDIDFIIFATSTPDHTAPGSACFLQHKMGFNNIGALDIRVQCSGFVYGLSIADQYIRSGMYKNILLVGAEIQSPAMDLTDEGRDVSVIFGDGAGAAIVSATEEDRGILSTHLHSEGEYAKELWMELPISSRKPRFMAEDAESDGQWLQMNGREVFRHAVIRFPEVINEALDANGWKVEDIKLIVPHQANIRISNEVARRLGGDKDLVYSNIHKYGNTTAATIPIAMHEALHEGRFEAGDKLILAAFGAGFTWAAAAIKW